MTVAAVALDPALAEIAAALHAASGFAEAWDAKAFAALLAMPGTSGRLAVGQDEPIGVILWRVAADEAEILTICVAPGRRRDGVGRFLLDQAFAVLAAAGIGTLWLEVAVDNRAATALYRASGFSERGRRKEYYATPRGRVDALILAKELMRKTL